MCLLNNELNTSNFSRFTNSCEETPPWQCYGYGVKTYSELFYLHELWVTDESNKERQRSLIQRLYLFENGQNHKHI